MRESQTPHVPDAFDLCNAVVGDPRQSGDDLKHRKKRLLSVCHTKQSATFVPTCLRPPTTVAVTAVSHKNRFISHTPNILFFFFLSFCMFVRGNALQLYKE